MVEENMKADEFVEYFMGLLKSGHFNKCIQQNEGPEPTDEYIEKRVGDMDSLLGLEFVNKVLDGVVLEGV